MANLLENIQDVTLEIGHPSPGTVFSNDLIILQLAGYMNRVGKMLLSEHDWQSLTKTYNIDTIAITYQGTTTSGSNIIAMPITNGLTSDFQISGDGIPSNSMVTAVNDNVNVIMSGNATKSQTLSFTFSRIFYDLPTDFDRFIRNTQYDSANRFEMDSATPQAWSYYKAGWLSGTTRLKYRILGNKLAIYPPQGSGRTLTFEYISKNFVIDSGGNQKSRFTSDGDTCLFPDSLMIMGCKLKFWEQKGFDSTLMAADYSRELAKYKGQQSPSQAINACVSQDSHGFNFPDGNFGQ